MKTSTSICFAVLLVSSLAACSSSEGDGTGGGEATVSTSSAGSGGSGGTGGTEDGSGGTGGGNECPDPPLDCIGGEYGPDANGCTVCTYFQCAVDVCPEDSPTEECAGFNVTICDRGDGECGVLSSDGNGMDCPDGFVCADGEWTCGCPDERPELGSPCGDPGRSCEVPSDVDCGPLVITVFCTEDGWSTESDGAGGGGEGCG